MIYGNSRENASEAKSGSQNQSGFSINLQKITSEAKGSQNQSGFSAIHKKYSDQLSTTALVRRNATKNLENSCFILN